MTAPTGEVTRVTGSQLTLERTLAREPEGVMVTVDITSSASTPVAVQVVQDLPASWAITEIGVHPRHEPREFTADPSRVIFADVVGPDDDLTVVYGVRVADAERVDPPAPPAVEEAVLAAREDLPFGLTEDGGLAPPGTATTTPSDAAISPDWLGADVGPGDDGTTEAAPGGEPGGSNPTPRDRDDGTGVDDIDAFEFEFGDDRPPDDDGRGTERPDLFDPAPETEPPSEGSSPADALWPDEPDHQPAVDGPDATGAAPPPGDDPAPSRSPPGDEPGAAGPVPEPTVGAPDGVESADSVTEAIEGATNVLVLADHADTADSCTRLLDRQVPPDRGMVLASFLESVDDRLEALEGLSDGPREIDLISMGEQLRTNTADTSTLSTPIGDVTVTTIADATDLVRLGVHVGRALDDAGDRPALCLHSLSALVGLVDLQRVFRFVHVLSGRVRAVDGRAHYHLDPETVDERAFATLRQLFEVVVRYKDGEFVLE